MRAWRGCGSVVGAVVLVILMHGEPTLRTAAAAVKPPPSPAIEQARALSKAFEEVASSVKPSVVNINSTKKLQVGGRSALPDEDRLREFFGDDFADRFFALPRQPRDFVQRGQGTGVVVSADGYILTNNHVVGGADDIVVKLADNREFPAKVVGTDEKTDLAVVKIDAKNLPAAELGDSDAVTVGEWVLAIGNPFGLSQTVTAGIISAKGRANVGIADYEDFLQTDAAINPGNSGGPLVNLDGEVIGINTAIATRTGSYQGVGFAIPTNMARAIMQAIINEGRVVRGWLGVAIQNLTPELARSFGYEGKDGVLIGDVTGGGPADKAGIQVGDILVKIDGKTATDMNQVRNLVASIKPGTKVKIELVREGKPRDVTLEIGELEGGAGATGGGTRETTEDLGLTVQTLTPELAEKLDLDAEEGGVVVTDVKVGSLAEKEGIRVKDVIVSVGGQRIRDVAGFRAALKKHDLKEGVRLQIKSGGVKRFVFLKR